MQAEAMDLPENGVLRDAEKVSYFGRGLSCGPKPSHEIEGFRSVPGRAGFPGRAALMCLMRARCADRVVVCNVHHHLES
jgi:hypothetical protein